MVQHSEKTKKSFTRPLDTTCKKCIAWWLLPWVAIGRRKWRLHQPERFRCLWKVPDYTPIQMLGDAPACRTFRVRTLGLTYGRTRGKALASERDNGVTVYPLSLWNIGGTDVYSIRSLAQQGWWHHLVTVASTRARRAWPPRLGDRS